MWVAFAFAFAKATHIFSNNTCALNTEISRTVNILTTNELVMLTMLWTTGPRFSNDTPWLCFVVFLLYEILCHGSAGWAALSCEIYCHGSASKTVLYYEMLCHGFACRVVLFYKMSCHSSRRELIRTCKANGAVDYTKPQHETMYLMTYALGKHRSLGNCAVCSVFAGYSVDRQESSAYFGGQRKLRHLADNKSSDQTAFDAQADLSIHRWCE